MVHLRQSGSLRLRPQSLPIKMLTLVAAALVPAAPSAMASSSPAVVAVRRYQLAEPLNGAFATESENTWVNESVALVPKQTALVCVCVNTSAMKDPVLIVITHTHPHSQPHPHPQPHTDTRHFSNHQTANACAQPTSRAPRTLGALFRFLWMCGTTTATRCSLRTRHCEFFLCLLQLAVLVCSSYTHRPR